MQEGLKRAGAIALASLEWLYLKLLSLLVIGAIARESWRGLTASAETAVVLPKLLSLAILLPLMWLLRHRYAMPTATVGLKSVDARERLVYVLLVLAVPPAALLASVDQFSSAQTLELIQWRSLIASLFGVMTIALLEESLYRLALMGLLLRAGMPPWLVLISQGVVFMAAHGSAPFIGPHSLAWYATISFTFGMLYWVSRSLAAPLAMHFMLNLLLAQTSPQSYWLTQRTIESLHQDWTRVCTWAFLSINLAFLLWRWFCAGPISAMRSQLLSP